MFQTKFAEKINTHISYPIKIFLQKLKQFMR